MATVKLNARRRHRSVRALRGRLLEPVAGERFDIITSSPPYVPAPTDELPRRGPSRARVAAGDGGAVLDAICDQDPGQQALGTIPAGIDQEDVVIIRAVNAVARLGP